MTIYQCDFCKKTKPCVKTLVDDMEYDICKTCKENRSGLLKDRGSKRQPSVWPYVYYVWPYWQGNWPVYVQPNYVPITPTITCEGIGTTTGNISLTTGNMGMLVSGHTQ